MSIVIVEPDLHLREQLAICLQRQTGFYVVGAGDDIMQVCQAVAEAEPVHVLIADLDRADLRSIHAWATIHVLLPEARIVGLTEGDDIRILEAALAAGVTALHPFSVEPDILCRAVSHAACGIVDYDARLIEVAKSFVLQPVQDMQVRFGGLTIDLRLREVTRWGRHVHLTPLEFRVLAYLAEKRGRPARLEELLAAVWSASPWQGGTLAQVHNCVKRIRKKIEPDVNYPRYLLCERGWGYFLQDPTVSRSARHSAQPPAAGQSFPGLDNSPD